MLLFSASVTLLVVSFQVLMTPRYRSSSLIRPLLNILVMESTLASASAMSSFFSGGMAASHTATVKAPLVEYL